MIGILGGGQLARMLAVAASRLGYQTHIYDPNPDSPAIEVATRNTVADFDNQMALTSFAQGIDILTYEFENIPTFSLELISKEISVFPEITALSISQDRIVEKDFLTNLGLKTVKYARVNSFYDYEKAIKKILLPSVLKTCRFGYDGKGQLIVTKDTTKDSILNLLKHGPCILEGFLDFKKELSVIVARGQSGEIVSFDPGENIHSNGVLKTTEVPANVPTSIQMDAVIIAGKIVNAIDYVGVMGVELFLTASNELLVNEIAPRVHNSGHWTQNGCVIDQFEQHIRAISGCKLGSGKRHANVKMVNLLGSEIMRSFEEKDAAVHVYGKKKITPGRKMGHINYVKPKSD